ncbi:MAG TPA: segregation/condensation protein A [Terriglobales bacterium]|nr:segregation/condensation protein A [Terriglobales bacterium]
MVEPSSAAEASRAEAARQKLAAQAEASPFLVQIGQLYEGPFDLLLDLIRRQNINIYDIPIAAITTQYLHYLATLRDLDLEVAAEFLVVAATLIQIKSKMMLPADPVLPGEATADPREELVQRLLEYETFKQAAAQLHERQQLEEASWSRPQGVEAGEEDDELGQLAVGVHDLVATFRQVLQRLQERPQLEIVREEVSVREMMELLHRLLAASAEPVAVRPLFQRAPSRGALLATFLAVLELVKMNVALLRQERPFGDILLKRHRRFQEAWEQMVTLAPSEPGPERVQENP